MPPAALVPSAPLRALRAAAFAHDPGGANAVAVVALALRAAGVGVDLVGRGPAIARFAALGADYREAGGGDPDSAAAAADVVITGTSEHDVLEQEALAAARRLGVPSLVVLDFWGNMPLRFTSRIGADISPSAVTALDAACAAEAAAAGVPPDRIFTTGSPWFGLLSGSPAARVPHPAGRRILVPSQPMAGEVGALAVIAAACAAARVSEVRVRMHPRASNRDEVAGILAASGRPVVVDASASVRDSLSACDVVLGMNSAVLIEAALAGWPTARAASADYGLPASLDGLVPPFASAAGMAAFIAAAGASAGGEADVFRALHAGAGGRVADLAILLAGCGD
jgi:hypothetical protein